MRLMRTGLLILVAAASSCVVSFGAVFTEDWLNAGAQGWQLGAWPDSGQFTGSGGGVANSSGALQTSYTVGVNPPFYADVIFANSGASGGNFTGDYTTDAVSFSYIGTLNGDVGLYFTGNSNSWYYNIPTPGVAAWNSSPQFSFASQAGWSWLSGTGNGTFATDVLNVTDIGVGFTWPTTGGPYTFGIDNFRRGPLGGGYAVPEPGTYAALGFAFASMGLTFRRRLNEGVEKIKGMLKA